MALTVLSRRALSVCSSGSFGTATGATSFPNGCTCAWPCWSPAPLAAH
jgi:hypothetical protein